MCSVLQRSTSVPAAFISADDTPRTAPSVPTFIKHGVDIVAPGRLRVTVPARASPSVASMETEAIPRSLGNIGSAEQHRAFWGRGDCRMRRCWWRGWRTGPTGAKESIFRLDASTSTRHVRDDHTGMTILETTYSGFCTPGPFIFSMSRRSLETSTM